MKIGKLIETSAQLIRSRISFKKQDIPLTKSLVDLLSYRLTWSKHDLDHLPPGRVSKQFMSARRAVQMIPDNATVISTGIG